MEAIQRWFCATMMVAMGIFGTSTSLSAANARSQNFLVHAPTQALAEQVAQGAERYRDELAEYWLGERLAPWRTPCPIEVVTGPNLAAQGVTQYDRHTGRNFQMRVIGTPLRIMDSVLPHEVTHTVLATHFGGPLPRWADEGICTTVEHDEERRKHEIKLREFLQTRRGIAMNKLFLMTEYPSDMLPMYAQGYSVCRFLIAQSGPRQFIQFLTDYKNTPSWTKNVQKHYGYDSLAKLQEKWLAWVADGGDSRSIGKFVSSRSRATGSVASASLASNRTRSSQLNRADGRSAGRNGDSSEFSGSWYLRRRNEIENPRTATGSLIEIPPPAPERDLATPLANAPVAGFGTAIPPSVAASGRYSVSQPQGEQQYGRTARTYR